MSVCTHAIKLDGGNFSELEILSRLVMLDYAPSWIELPWLGAVVGSILIGLSGVLPLLIIPLDETKNLKQGDSANSLKTLLSFAVGGLLGDVFLHAFPEIWGHTATKNGNAPSMYNGLLVLSGLMIFVVAEKLFSVIGKLNEEIEEESAKLIPEKINNNNNIKGYDSLQAESAPNSKKRIAGYLNLLANSVDNFTHGLSVGGAFLVSNKTGCLATLAILVHEIPHEVGDFAILLKSGFTRWDAARGQLLTAGVGLLGSMAAVFCSGASNSIEARTSWILPLTSGTFLHIAMVTVLPDLLKEEDPVESFKQLFALLLGILIMGFVGVALE